MSSSEIRVVHLAITPVAGSPWNIVKALNQHTNIAARLILLKPKAYGARTFPVDLVWPEDREECLAILDAADLIHLHQWFNPGDWFGPDIGAICGAKACIRQWHSVPTHFAGNDPAAVQEIIDSPFAQLVIGQYPERYYPRARIVPNLVPLDDPLLARSSGQRGEVPQLAWSPSGRESAWEMRWGSKGYPETLPMLKRLVSEGRCTIDVIENQPHETCLIRRAAANIVLDELVTGSYHLSGLEGLAQGKPVLGWLDDRTQNVLREITGISELPWVNVHLEDAETTLRVLLADTSLRDAIGAYSHQWMMRWYNDRALIQQYVHAYRDLLERPDLFSISREADLAAHWRNVQLPDLLWKARRDRGQATSAFKWLKKLTNI